MVIMVSCSLIPVYGGESAVTLGAVDRLEIAREIAKQQAIGQKHGITKRLIGRPYQPSSNHAPKARISWDEIKTACGLVPTDKCITKYYNENL